MFSYFLTGQLIKTSRGGETLLLDGFTYNRKCNSKDDCFRWYCCRYHKGCKVTIITSFDNKLVQLLGTHIHGRPRIFNSGEITCIFY